MGQPDLFGRTVDWRIRVAELTWQPHQVAFSVIACLILLATAGCGNQSAERTTADRPRASDSPPARERPAASASPSGSRANQQRQVRNRAAAPLPEGPRTLADLVTEEGDAGAEPPVESAPFQLASPDGPRSVEIPIDATRAAAAGIRELHGQHLTLYTDVPPGPKVDNLPGIFDLAVPQWCAYFGIDPAHTADWHVTGFLMQEPALFQATGLMPGDLPPFPNGYQRGRYLWVYDQSTAYYSRHLVLHEGTHAFMEQILGGLGPPWYAEGMAELLGTHLWRDGQLQVGFRPADKEEVPGWGRVKIIREELAAGRGMMPRMIMEYGPQAHRDNAPYGWCWGLTAFLDGHPATRETFRQLPRRLSTGDVTTWLREQLQDQWSALSEEWQVFVMSIEYGYDFERAAIVRRPPEPVPPGGATATIDVARGWQSTGWRLEPGISYEVIAEGRYQVAETGEVWWCEPNGVTIHYYQGRPLGMLLGAVRDDERPLNGLSPLVRPEPFGLQRTWSPQWGGTLYLKINESAAELADNRGEITIRLRPGG